MSPNGCAAWRSAAPNSELPTLKLGTRPACAALRANEFRRDGKPYYQNGVGLKEIEPLLPLIADLGWHLQLWVDARDLPDMASALARVPVPVVVDHMGRLEYHHGTHNPGFQALLRGVGEGKLWAKLSGTYRLGATAPDYAQARPFHDALVAANPRNLVWGTDWPHPRPEGPVPDAARLLAVFLDWTGGSSTAAGDPQSTIRRGSTIFRKRESLRRQAYARLWF